jgi:hypothetical protein
MIIMAVNGCDVLRDHVPKVAADLLQVAAEIRGVSIRSAIVQGIGADHEDVVKTLRSFDEKIEY